MNYPDCLLPQSNYKSIITDITPYFLIRHFVIKNGLNDVLDDNGELKAQIIGQENQLPDLSTSLYGIYKEEHIKYVIINSFYLDNWKGDETIPNELINNDDFFIKEERSFWSTAILLLHNIDVKINGEAIARCEVNHSPINGNYWHFSLNWYMYKERKYWHKDYDNISITKILKKSIRDFIKINSNISTPLNTVIEESIYKI
ncbi:hypothetical protein B0A69_09675 [Chryseobacterium shigense]|uniref:Uncharacterized protein n=1 Tax=Chryseobacterium shigense TaxID=297244 RepID=A0A1N7IGJ3_9FLAO|nr:hypothetical protein [Chryseobacterium shigense]PQA94709.1 hypothetical protein B0A69_09675 [Chryseobacterium shigense]SIS36207.1 hypothetical protein SAMN05421639_103725 [Chryseobacterium shigense]